MKVLAVIVQAVDGGMTLVPAQLDALRSEGHIVDDDRCDLTRPQILEWLVAHPEFGVCDFCNEPGVAWDFPALDHTLISGDTSVGNWRACEQCAKLINAGRRNDLARRAVRHGGIRLMVLRKIQDEFWSHRQGPGRRIGDGPEK